MILTSLGAPKSWALFLCLSASGTLAAEQLQLLAEQSQISFQFWQQGKPVTGEVGRFSVEAGLQQQSIDSIHLRIASNSLMTGSTDRDNTLQGDLWLATGLWPEIIYRGSSDDDQHFNGQLRLLDNSLPIRLATRQWREGDIWWISTEGTLNRLDYGLGQGRWQATDIVADKVTFSARFGFVSK